MADVILIEKIRIIWTLCSLGMGSLGICTTFSVLPYTFTLLGKNTWRDKGTSCLEMSNIA